MEGRGNGNRNKVKLESKERRKEIRKVMEKNAGQDGRKKKRNCISFKHALYIRG